MRKAQFAGRRRRQSAVSRPGRRRYRPAAAPIAKRVVVVVVVVVAVVVVVVATTTAVAVVGVIWRSAVHRVNVHRRRRRRHGTVGRRRRRYGRVERRTALCAGRRVPLRPRVQHVSFSLLQHLIEKRKNRKSLYYKIIIFRIFH